MKPFKFKFHDKLSENDLKTLIAKGMTKELIERFESGNYKISAVRHSESRILANNLNLEKETWDDVDYKKNLHRKRLTVTVKGVSYDLEAE